MMRRVGTLLGAVVAALGLILALGCAQDPMGAASRGSAPPPAPTDVAAADFASARFDQSTTVDNTWFPLRPGTQYVYTGTSLDDGRRLPHRVVFTVTDMTKVVAGIEAVVGWDRDYTEGELVEAELVFFAQDTAGNVWHLGQYPEEYEDGEFVEAQAWIAGVKGATAGVYIRADEVLGASDYAQGFAPPPVSWHDRARVFQVGRTTCVPVSCYDGVLVMEEFERDKPEAFQLKYYAPGVGNVRVGWRGAKEDSREVLVLERMSRLNPEQMAHVRTAVTELERSAYRRSPDVYGATARAR
jgi:hypothetical protein